MEISRSVLSVCIVAVALGVTVNAHAQGITDMKKGEGGSVVKGAAGTDCLP